MEEEERFAAGKGINVSKTLAALGIKNTAFFLCGEDNGQLFLNLLNEQKNIIPFDYEYIDIPGSVRENITFCIKGGKELKINRTGLDISGEKLHIVFVSARSNPLGNL